MLPGAADAHHAAVEAELAAERHEALRRTGRKVDEALDRCRARQVELDRASGPVERRDALVRYRRARDELEHARWKLCVQREAMGLTDHRWVHRTYPLPARV